MLTKSYFIQRTELYSLPTMAHVYPQPKLGEAAIKEPFTLLTEHPEGIEIHYRSVWGYKDLFKPGNSRFANKPFTRICLSTEARNWPTYKENDQRYKQDSGSGTHVFFTNTVFDNVHNGTPFDILYLVEGELKALAAWHWSVQPHKLPPGRKGEKIEPLNIIGLPSINAYKEKGEPGLHYAIKEVLEKCKPTKVVILHDADFRSLPKWDPTDEKLRFKDLGSRIYNFYNAATQLKDLLSNYTSSVFFGHINESFNTVEVKSLSNKPSHAKGLDDLFLTAKGMEWKIILDLQKLESARDYFTIQPITSMSAHKFREYMLYALKDGVPKLFYQHHQLLLQQHQFVFNKNIYKQNPENGEIEFIRDREAQNYIRLGTKYFKIVYTKTSKGSPVRILEPWTTEALKVDHPYNYKSFINSWIRKFDTQCNIPCNNDKYEAEIIVENDGIISKNFNLYYPTTYKPTPGEWTKIEMFLKHIFQGKYDIGLDWIYLAWCRPTVKLPAIALVSPEKDTGKSTLIYLFEAMWGQNATVIGNEELNSGWNDDFISKAIIGVEESFIEKKVILEKLKAMITAPNAKLAQKFSSRVTVEFHGKLILNSNDDKNFIRIDEDEFRYFINRVPVIPEATREHDLLDKMVAELPNFIHYLENSHVLTNDKSRGRLWFSKDDLTTEAMHQVKEESKSSLSKEIQILITDKFYHYWGINNNPLKNPVLTLYYIREDIIKLLKERDIRNINSHYVSQVLKTDLKLPEPRQSRPDDYIEYTETPLHGADNINFIKAPNARYYQFKIENFISHESMEQDFGITMDEVLKYRMGNSHVPLLEEVQVLPF